MRSVLLDFSGDLAGDFSSGEGAGSSALPRRTMC